jgi:hypothetical protein
VNPTAAEEILNIIMLDDYVQRKQALADWSRRWLTTMHVEMNTEEEIGGGSGYAVKLVLLRKIWSALIHDEVNVLHWFQANPKNLTCEMHCIMQKPRVL